MEWIPVESPPPVTVPLMLMYAPGYDIQYKVGHYDWQHGTFEDTKGYELFGVTHWATLAPPVTQEAEK